MPDGDLARLRREFLETGGMIGELLYELITDVTRTIVFSPRYNGLAPQVAQVGSWDEIVEDIAHDVIVDDLFLERSRYIDHVFTVARSADGVRGLIGARVHRNIKRRRERSVIDVLLDRARPVLESEPYASFDTDRAGQPDGFQLTAREKEIERRHATDDELSGAARDITLIPTTATNASQRSPRVYGQEEFQSVLRTACDRIPALLYMVGLRAILEIVLTDWTVGRPVSIEEAIPVAAGEPDPAVAALERANARTFLDLLEDDEVELLRQMLAGYRDQESADYFACSRQAINGRKGRMRDRLSEVIGTDDFEGGAIFLEELHLLVLERTANRP